MGGYEGRRRVVQEFTQRCLQGDLRRALKAMDSMDSLRLWAHPTPYFNLARSSSHSQGHLHLLLLLRIHRHLFSRSPPYPSPTPLSNFLLNLYLKVGLLTQAHHLFDLIPRRNVVSWTTLISAYSSSPHLRHKALPSLVLMLREGVSPNMFTYSSLLRAACDAPLALAQLHSRLLKDGFQSNSFVRSALIDVYSKLGLLPDALRVFHRQDEDLVVWNSMIAGLAQNHLVDEALSLFKHMKRRGNLADHPTLTSVLRACSGMALLELGRQLHAHALKLPHDLILSNSLLDMYCKCGSLEDAETLFHRGMVVKDVVSWSTMVAGLALNGYSRWALSLFHSMKASGTKPNYITIVGVLFACSHAGLLEDGWYYFRSMTKLYGITPGREHYGCMIDLLGRAGKLDEALRFINAMEIEPDIVTWKALLGACKIHRNVDLAVHAAEQILRLDPQDAGAYVLLSNIYANTGRWTDVAQIRRSLDDRGIRKEPGCSWIEVDRKIHAFIFGDNSHPQFNEINIGLGKLIQKLLAAGYFPDANFVLQDLEEEQKESSLRYHSEKLALVFGLMSLPKGQAIRIRKNLRICGDCHLFAKLAAKLENCVVVIRDPIRYHHFKDGSCSCGDYW